MLKPKSQIVAGDTLREISALEDKLQTISILIAKKKAALNREGRQHYAFLKDIINTDAPCLSTVRLANGRTLTLKKEVYEIWILKKEFDKFKAILKTRHPQPASAANRIPIESTPLAKEETGITAAKYRTKSILTAVGMQIGNPEIKHYHEPSPAPILPDGDEFKLPTETRAKLLNWIDRTGGGSIFLTMGARILEPSEVQAKLDRQKATKTNLNREREELAPNQFSAM